MKKIIKTAVTILIILISNFLILGNTVQALENQQISLQYLGQFNRILKYNGIPIKTSHVVSNNGGQQYPAYCLNVDLPGVEENNQYHVEQIGKITDLGLWRVIINGYPYKTLEQLGVANEEEAYIATKQAVYCYLENRGTENYEGIGEAGQRTLRALNLILENARNSTEIFENTNIEINESKEWEVDEMDMQYISKIYELKSNINIASYTIALENQPDGCKITDMNNQERNNFYSGEKFKILIPIMSLKESGNFKVKIYTQMETKPVFYGKSPSSELQDYALTAYNCEDIKKEFIQEYEKNDTEIIIEKQDDETKETLFGAKFEILNENKKVIRVAETDENGEIHIKELLPGVYYIREIKAPTGYHTNTDMYKVEIKMNEKVNIIVKNSKIEIVTVEVSEIPETSEIEQTKLPVTGM